MWTQISGRMPASSQASSELSTASLIVVSRALRGLSKPSRWRFLAKNSLTEISRWLAAIDWAVARRRRCCGSSGRGGRVGRIVVRLVGFNVRSFTVAIARRLTVFGRSAVALLARPLDRPALRRRPCRGATLWGPIRVRVGNASTGLGSRLVTPDWRRAELASRRRKSKGRQRIRRADRAEVTDYIG